MGFMVSAFKETWEVSIPPTCSSYTLAYIHHLFKAGELLGLQLVTAHNIFFMNKLMSDIRNAIVNDSLDDAEKEWLS